MRPPYSASAGLARRSVGPCGASPCSTPVTVGRVKCYQKWVVGQFHDATLDAARRVAHATSMPKRSSSTDPNVLAAAIVGAATNGDKNPAAVALGRMGGLKGGKA